MTRMRPLPSIGRWISGMLPIVLAGAIVLPARSEEVPVPPLKETTYAVVYVEKASSDSPKIRAVQQFLIAHGMKPRTVDMATINPTGNEMRNLAIGTAGGDIQFPGVEINGRFFTTPWEAEDQAAMLKVINSPFDHQAAMAAGAAEMEDAAASASSKPSGFVSVLIWIRRAWFILVILVIPFFWLCNEGIKKLNKTPVEGEEGETPAEGGAKPEAPAAAPMATGVPDPACHKVIFNGRECDYTVRAGNLYIAGMTFDLFGSLRPEPAMLVLASGTKLKFVYHEPPPDDASGTPPQASDTQSVAT